MKLLLAFAQALLLLCGVARGDFLSEYLRDKTFGRVGGTEDQGPCPETSPCVGNRENLSPSVQAIEICLLFNSVGCGSLGEILRGGEYKIKNLVCKEISVQDMRFTSVGIEAARFLLGRVNIDQARLNCEFDMDADRLVLELLTVFKMTMTWSNAKARFRQTMSDSGSDVQASAYFEWPSGGAVATDVPDRLTIPFDDCDIDPDFGLRLNLNENEFDYLEICISWIGCARQTNLLWGIIFRLINWSAVVSALANLFEGLIGNIACQVLEQAAWLDAPTNTQPGILNEIWFDIRNQFIAASTAVADDLRDEDSDAFQLARWPNVNQSQLDAAWDLSNNTLAEVVSVTLNNWLGGTTTSDPANPNRLVINEVVDSLTEPDGYFLSGSLLGNDLSYSAEGGVTFLTVRLDELQMLGLNTFELFKVLQNGYEDDQEASFSAYKRTFNNTFEMDTFGVRVRVYVKMARGSWVAESCVELGSCAPRPDDSSEFTFTYDMKLRDVELEAAFATAFNDDEYNNLRMGQMTRYDYIGTSATAINYWAEQCLAAAFYTLRFTSIRGSVSAIEDPVLVGFEGVGLTQFVQGVLDFVTFAIKGATKTNFPGLAQGPLRDFLNNRSLEWVEVGRFRGTRNCPQWRPDISQSEILEVDFDEGFASYLYPLVNDALGGDPVVNKDSDINEIVETLLKFYELKLPDLFIDSWDNTTFPATPFPQGYWEPKDIYQESSRLPAFQDAARFLWFTDFFASGINSIYRLTADKVPEVLNFDRGVEFELALGGAMRKRDPSAIPLLEDPNPINVGFQFQVVDPSKGISETWDFLFTLEELELGFIMDNVIWNVNRFYNLFYPQVYHIPCILQALNNIGFPQSGRKSVLQTLNFNVDEVSSSSTGTPPIRAALLALAADTLITNPANPNYNLPEQVTRRKTTQRFKGMVNSFAKGIMNYGLDLMEDLPERYVEEKITARTCLEEDDVFAGAADLAALSPPNFTYFEVVCLAPVQTPPSPTSTLQRIPGYNEDRGDDEYNFETSEGFKLFRQVINNGDTLNDILIGLANSTDGAFAQYLKLNTSDPGNIRVDLEFPLAKLGFFYNSTILPGFIADAGTLYVEGINRFVRPEDNTDDYKLLDPVEDSSVVLKNKFQFTDTTPLVMQIVSVITVDSELANATELPMGTQIEEILVFDMVVNGLTLEFDTALAINEELFGALSLAHFFQSDENQTFFLQDHWVDCLFYSIFDGGVFIEFIDMNVTDLVGPTLVTTQEFVSPGVELFLQSIVDIIKDFYFLAIPNIADNCLRTFINDELRAYWVASQVPGACPALDSIALPPLAPENQYYRFDTAEDWIFVQDFITEYVAGEDGDYSDFNEIISAAFAPGFFNQEDGEDILYRDIPLVYDKTQYGIGGFALRDMRIINEDPNTPGGIGSFTELRLLEPYTVLDEPEEEDRRRRRAEGINYTDIPVPITDMPYTTLTSIKINGPMVIRAYYELNATDVFPDVPNMVNQLEVDIRFEELVLRLALMMKVDIRVALRTRFSSISSFDELPCLFVPVDELVPLDFDFTFEQLSLRLECRGQCDLFGKYGLGDAGIAIDTRNDPTFRDLNDFFNTFVEFWVSYIDSRGAQTAIDTFINSAEEQCARLLGLLDSALNVPPSTAENVAATFGIIFLGAAGLGGGFTAMLFPAHKRRRQKLMATVLARHKDVANEEELAGIMAITELAMRSNFHHPVTPMAAKFIVPTICLLNVVGLIIAIVFSDAANIVIQFTLFGIVSRNIALVPFTIISTINDIWNSGAYPLAFLIAVASCAWPVVKNLLLVVFWFLPKTMMRAKKQRGWLELMDLLGKWSFLDVYVIVIMLAALRTYVSASYFSFGATLDDDFFVADVNVTPETGIILLCFVAAMSLIMNHVLIFYHDRVQASNAISEDKINGNFIGKVPARAAVKRRVMNHIFVGKDSDGRVRRISPKGAVALLATCVFGFFMIVFGLSLKFITFEMRGLVGILLEFVAKEAEATGQTPAQFNIKSYSLIQMGTELANAPSETAGDAVALVFFQFLYFIAVLVAPLLSIIMCVALFVLPMNLPALRRFHFFAKLAFYWSAIEVLTVGIIMTTIEIGVVTAFIVDFITNDVCGYVQAAIGLLVEDPADAFCLDVTGYFEPSAALLILGAVLHLFVYFVVATVSHAVADDRYFAAYHDLRNDVKPKRLNRVERLTLRLFTNTFQADNEGVEGLSAFYNLDGSNFDGQVEIERDAVGRLCDWLCSSEKGEQAADARIEAWQKRFGVGGGGNIDVGGPAPGYGGPPSGAMSSPNPTFMSAAPTNSARVRSSSQDSVDV